jgi:hypothetical protein
MSKINVYHDLFDISCEKYKRKIVNCYDEYNKMYFRRKKKLRECEENIQNYQYCLVSLNKDQINSEERTTAVFENNAEMFDKHFQRRKEEKLTQLEYLDTRNPDLAPKVNNQKYTVEL